VSVSRTITLEKLDLPISQLVIEELAFEIGGVAIGPMGAVGILAVFGAVFILLSTLTFVKVDFSRMNRNWADAMDL
jgi:ABC-2 type transport system permease protein